MNKLQAWMALHDISQAELARRLNVSQPSVWAWLNGEAVPSVANLRRLSNLTGIALDDLIPKDVAA